MRSNRVVTETKLIRGIRQNKLRSENGSMHSSYENPDSSLHSLDYRSSLIAAKQSLQYTGLPLVGWKGTLASLPHLAQVVVKYSLCGL